MPLFGPALFSLREHAARVAAERIKAEVARRKRAEAYCRGMP